MDIPRDEIDPATLENLSAQLRIFLDGQLVDQPERNIKCLLAGNERGNSFTFSELVDVYINHEIKRIINEEYKTVFKSRIQSVVSALNSDKFIQILAKSMLELVQESATNNGYY